MQAVPAVVLLEAAPLNSAVLSTSECLEVDFTFSLDTTVSSVLADLQGALSAMNYSSSVPLDHRAALALVLHRGPSGAITNEVPEDDENEGVSMPWSPVSPHGWMTAMVKGDATGVVLCGTERLLDNPVVLAALETPSLDNLLFRVVPAPVVASATAAIAASPPPLFSTDAVSDVAPAPAEAEESDEVVVSPPIGSSAQTGGARTAFSAPDERASDNTSPFDLPGRAGGPGSSCAVIMDDLGLDGALPTRTPHSPTSQGQSVAVSSYMMSRGPSPFDALQWTAPDDADSLAGTGRQLSTLPSASPKEVRAAREALSDAMQRALRGLDNAFAGGTDVQPPSELPLLRHRVLTAMAEEAALFEAEADRLRRCTEYTRRWKQDAITKTAAEVQQMEAELTARRNQQPVVAQLRTQLATLQGQLEQHRRREAQLLHTIGSTPASAQKATRFVDAHETWGSEDDESDSVLPSPGPPSGEMSAVDSALRRALQPMARTSAPRPVVRAPEQDVEDTAGHVLISTDSESSTTESEDENSRTSPALSPPHAPHHAADASPAASPSSNSLCAASVATSAAMEVVEEQPAETPAAPVVALTASVQYSASSSTMPSARVTTSTRISSRSSSRSSSSVSRGASRGAVAGAGRWQPLESSFDGRPPSRAHGESDDPNKHSAMPRQEGYGDDICIEDELDSLRNVTSKLNTHLQSPKPDANERRQLLKEVRALRQRLDSKAVPAGRRDPLRTKSSKT